MKRLLNFILISLIVIITLLMAFTVKIYADSDKITAENFKPTYHIKLDNEKKIARTILGYIRNITAVATVIIIAFFGLKFMVGSADERAEYKKSFIPLIIGVFIVLISSTAMQIVWNLDKKQECEHVFVPIGNGFHRCKLCKEKEQCLDFRDEDGKCDFCGASMEQNHYF